MNTRHVVGVTGAGSGIGAAIATHLSQRGFHVVVTDINGESAARLAGTLASADARALDVTNPEQVEAVVGEIVAEHGRLDAWVSNAGVSKMQRFVDISPADLRWNFEINTFGVFYCGQAVARAMMRLGTPGAIVNTASMAAKQGKAPFLADYIASKFAVLGLTQAMALELAPHNIRVNSVCPGFVATPMMEREQAWEAELRGITVEEVRQGWINDTPLRRLETPDDVAKVVAFLLSDDAAFLTGEAISVNGGAFMD
jgi:NAD(P)-dependent dehydrogenase (short-subunit alcohol dehydrogenase family)